MPGPFMSSAAAAMMASGRLRLPAARSFLHASRASRRWASQRATADSPGQSRLKFQPTGFRVPEGTKLAPVSSPEGSRLMLAVAAAGGLVVITWQVGTHTYFQSFTRGVLQHYTDGLRTLISSDTEDLVRQAMRDLGYDQDEMAATSAFLCYPTEAVTLGSVRTSPGLMVGLPSFVQKKEVDLTKIRLGKSKEGLSVTRAQSPEARELLASFDLSPDAKRFVAARELAKGREMRFVQLGSESGLAVLAALAGCRALRGALKDTLHFRRWPRAAPAAVYGAACLAWAWLVTQAQDLQRDWHAAGQDAKACALGPSYCRGGAEYYEKALQRHRAMRVLMGPEGASRFNLKGDLVPGILRPMRHRSLARRRDDCLATLAETSPGS